MAKNFSRSGRINDVLHRELAKLIREQCTDPRLGMVTISGVEVTSDLKYAKVYITVLEEDKQESSIEALNHATGFFRSQLAKAVALRTVPKLQFQYDRSLEIGNRVSHLLDTVKDTNISNDYQDD